MQDLNTKTIKVGSRGSKLALTQSKHVINLLKSIHKNLSFELITITTQGDTDRKSSLEKIGGTGVFTKKIEQALLDKSIDIAVHSAKDLPSVDTNGLTIGAVPPRAPFEDVWVANNNIALMDIKPNSIVGTSSPRRCAMLLNNRPDLEIREIRGNIETRLMKVSENKYDAVIVARAGLFRLDLENVITQILPVNVFVPAPGQGALAVQTRHDDKMIISLLQSINDENSFRCLCIERMLLQKLNAGCSVAIGGIASFVDNEIHLNSTVLSKNGKRKIVASHKIYSDSDNKTLVDFVAEDLIKQGAMKLING